MKAEKFSAISLFGGRDKTRILLDFVEKMSYNKIKPIMAAERINNFRRVVVFMAKGKVEFREAYCKGCSLCVNACPKKILQISKRTNAKGYEVAECINAEECIGCASCALMCPDSVITVYRD